MTVASAPSLGQPWEWSPLSALDLVGKPGDAEGRSAASSGLRPALLLPPASDAAPGDAPSLNRGGLRKLNVLVGSVMAPCLLRLYSTTQLLGSGLVGDVRVAA